MFPCHTSPVPGVNVFYRDPSGWLFCEVTQGILPALTLVSKILNMYPGSSRLSAFFGKVEQMEKNSAVFQKERE